MGICREGVGDLIEIGSWILCELPDGVAGCVKGLCCGIVSCGLMILGFVEVRGLGGRRPSPMCVVEDALSFMRPWHSIRPRR